MGRRPRPAGTKLRPTEAELEILKVIWDRGPSSVKEVHATLEAATGYAYTTVLKLMQIMQMKGLLTRNTTGKRHVFSAVEEKSLTQLSFLTDLLHRVFNDCPTDMVSCLIETQQLDGDQLESVKKLLKDIAVK